MILFLADNHYGTHGGRVLAEALAPAVDFTFAEDDWSLLPRLDEARPGDLLVLDMIADTCNVPPPGPAAVAAVRGYCERGGNLLLVHGGSAAFWPHAWWRPIVGFRWVRGEDPDGSPPSVHPRRPYRVEVAKTRHPLAAKLQPMDLPEDEIYTSLEQTCAASVLMTTTTQEGTFPMAWENRTPWGGRVLGFLPGHDPEVVRRPELVANARVLLEELAGGRD